MVRDNIFDSRSGLQIGYVEGKEAFNLKGRKLYDLDELNLIDPETGKIVGHLSAPHDRRTFSADHLFSDDDK
jgi:hypothetical protein